MAHCQMIMQTVGDQTPRSGLQLASQVGLKGKVAPLFVIHYTAENAQCPTTLVRISLL